VYLDVPYSEKDLAKQAGARWDPKVRRWYDPRPDTPELQRWAARPDVPELLPGEDRTFGDGLFVDLVPRSCWFTNVRSCVTDTDWERLRRPILRRAGHCCEACQAPEYRQGGRGLDVHERWHYDDQAGVQRLRRLVALCPPCHTTTHYGRAEITGQAAEAFAHLRAVAGMTDQQTHAHIAAAMHTWADRSRRVWELDLRILTDAGITLRRPPAAAERADVAERELHHARATDPAPAIPLPRAPQGPSGPGVEGTARRRRWPGTRGRRRSQSGRARA
jgi:hypothetical protein